MALLDAQRHECVFASLHVWTRGLVRPFLLLAEVKRRGRWEADRSLTRYEKSTLLQKIELEVKPRLMAQARVAETLGSLE